MKKLISLLLGVCIIATLLPIMPIVSAISKIPDEILKDFITKIDHLEKKYAVTYFEVYDNIRKAEAELSNMIDQLTGSEFDMKGLEGFKALLGE